MVKDLNIKRKIKKYEKIILAALEEEAKGREHATLKGKVVADKVNHDYLLLKMGWYDKYHFVNEILIHFEIKEDGKVWLLTNQTENPITEELIRQGIPIKEIVLGFYPESIRDAEGYAKM